MPRTRSTRRRGRPGWGRPGPWSPGRGGPGRPVRCRIAVLAPRTPLRPRGAFTPTLLLDGVIDATRQHRLTKRLFTRPDDIFQWKLPSGRGEGVLCGTSHANVRHLEQRPPPTAL